MAKPSNHKKSRKGTSTLLEKGLGCVAVGAGLLALTAILGDRPTIMAAVGTAVSMLGWWALGIGAVLVVTHLVRRFTRKRAPETVVKPFRPMTQPGTIRALIDKAESDILKEDAKRERERRQKLKAVRAAPAESVASDRVTATAASTSTQTPTPPQPQPPKTWSHRVLDAIEPRHFEAVCEALFSQAGFETRTVPHRIRGGADIWLHAKEAEMPSALVQCQHRKGQTVGVSEMRVLFDLMASNGLEYATYATNAPYTAEAQDFASANGINALGGTGLLALISKRSAKQQADLLAIATEGAVHQHRASAEV